MVLLWHSVRFRDAVLLVASLPVSPLAVFAAVRHKATTGTCRKFCSSRAPTGRKTVAAYLYVWSSAFLIFLSAILLGNAWAVAK